MYIGKVVSPTLDVAPSGTYQRVTKSEAGIETSRAITFGQSGRENKAPADYRKKRQSKSENDEVIDVEAIDNLKPKTGEPGRLIDIVV